MDPVAPLDYERWAVLVNIFPVPLSNTDEPSTASNGVSSIDGTVPSHAYGSSAHRDFQDHRATTGSRDVNENNVPLSHEIFPVSDLSSDMTDRVFRILLKEQDS